MMLENTQEVTDDHEPVDE